jgi:hypothetical protein
VRLVSRPGGHPIPYSNLNLTPDGRVLKAVSTSLRDVFDVFFKGYQMQALVLRAFSHSNLYAYSVFLAGV